VLPASFYSRKLSGTKSPRYCYSVFLRNLILLDIFGGDTNPRYVAELGPGFSIGIGLSALLAGAERYDGLDTKTYDIAEPTRRVFDELVQLFMARAPIPDNSELPEVKPRLQDYRFPEHILNRDRLDHALDWDRVERIRASLRGEGNGGPNDSLCCALGPCRGGAGGFPRLDFLAGGHGAYR